MEKRRIYYMDTNNRSNLLTLFDIGVRNDIIKAFKVKIFCDLDPPTLI